MSPKLKRRRAKAVKKNVKLSGGFSLLRTSLAEYRSNLKILGGTALIAAVVNWLIGFGSSTETAAIYQGLWLTFVSCSLIWAIRHSGGQARPKLAQVYWTGSAPALKFLLVVMVVALAMLPFSIGSFIFTAISGLDVSGEGGTLIAAGIWLVSSLLSLLLLARLLPALIIVTLPDIGPGKSIALSWRAVKGQSWRLSGRLIWLLVYSLLVVGLMSFALSQIKLDPALIKTVAEATTLVLVLPVLYLYLFKLYQELT